MSSRPWSRRLGRYWRCWFQPQHQHFVTCANLVAALDEHGLRRGVGRAGPAGEGMDVTSAVDVLGQPAPRPTPARRWLPPPTAAAPRPAGGACWPRRCRCWWRRRASTWSRTPGCAARAAPRRATPTGSWPGAADGHGARAGGPPVALTCWPLCGVCAGWLRTPRRRRRRSRPRRRAGGRGCRAAGHDVDRPRHRLHLGGRVAGGDRGGHLAGHRVGVGARRAPRRASMSRYRPSPSAATAIQLSGHTVTRRSWPAGCGRNRPGTGARPRPRAGSRPGSTRAPNRSRSQWRTASLAATTSMQPAALLQQVHAARSRPARCRDR